MGDHETLSNEPKPPADTKGVDGGDKPTTERETVNSASAVEGKGELGHDQAQHRHHAGTWSHDIGGTERNGLTNVTNEHWLLD
jgi:hypothetical protein